MEHFRKQGTKQELGLKKLIGSLPEIDTMVEIGSAYGESANIFASSPKIKKVICIDPWNNDREKHFDELCGNNPKIVKIKGRSLDVVKDFDKVDFVYVDGNHKYLACKKDIKAWKEKATKAIGGHDYCLRFPGVALAVAETLTGYEPHGGVKHPELFEDTSWLVKL